jgi:hypothetical protein
MPLTVPGVSVVVAPPPAFVVSEAAPKVPRDVVNATVAPSTGMESAVTTETIIVVDPPPIEIVLGEAVIPKMFPRLLGPVNSSTSAEQPQEITPAISKDNINFLMAILFFIINSLKRARLYSGF